MADLFAGLESFGLKDMDNIEVFEKKKEENGANGEVEKPKEVLEEDLLFDKTYQCPVCDKEFKSKMVRTGKVKLISADTDLRPKYQHVDSLKYDAVMCPYCGYAALNRYFNFVTNVQAKKVKEQISKNFKDPQAEVKLYDYETALARHKMALLNTVVKCGKVSERAYTCLKIAWLYRGEREQMLLGDYKKEDIKTLEENEKEFTKNAYEGFVDAFSKEEFPMCGMDEYTMMYLIAELARRVGDISTAFLWVSRVLTARDAQRRIKDKAVDLKGVLQQEKAKLKQQENQ